MQRFRNFDLPPEDFEKIEARIAHFIKDCGAEDFDELALDLYRWQLAHNAPYRRYAERVLGKNAAKINDWKAIPTVPTDAYKPPNPPLTCTPIQEAQAVFHTSGTTRETRGHHYFYSTKLYHLSVWQGWLAAQLPQVETWHLIPSHRDFPHGSLHAMMGFLDEHLPATHLLVDHLGQLDAAKWKQQHATTQNPILLTGTTLTLHQLLTEASSLSLDLQLPPGSWIFTTGGYKGRNIQLEPAAFASQLREHFAISDDHLITEYSMTELSSQFYAIGSEAPYQSPHWVRARVVDLASGREVADGELGILHITDLANLNSCIAIATQDIAKRVGNKFDLIGRDPNALPRGCSRTTPPTLLT